MILRLGKLSTYYQDNIEWMSGNKCNVLLTYVNPKRRKKMTLVARPVEKIYISISIDISLVVRLYYMS